MSHRYELTVNGVTFPVEVSGPGGRDRNLLSVLRDEIGLTGTKAGCDDCECGACMVLLDGQPANACSYLAIQAQGRAITTVEGLQPDGATGDEALHPLQRAMLDNAGVQCGFCTPGMLMSAHALLADNPSPTTEEIKIALSGNLCRCTGYRSIIDAVSEAAVKLRGRGAPASPPT